LLLRFIVGAAALLLPVLCTRCRRSVVRSVFPATLRSRDRFANTTPYFFDPIEKRPTPNSQPPPLLPAILVFPPSTTHSLISSPDCVPCLTKLLLLRPLLQRPLLWSRSLDMIHPWNPQSARQTPRQKLEQNWRNWRKWSPRMVSHQLQEHTLLHSNCRVHFPCDPSPITCRPHPRDAVDSLTFFFFFFAASCISSECGARDSRKCRRGRRPSRH
jgi:hypothetical protein